MRYDAAVPIEEGEVEFYLGLARDAEAKGYPTLELACGTGRIAIPMARQGIRLVGLDLSPPMLAAAREKSAGLETVRWVESDMRAFDLPESFGLITIPAGSFELLLTTGDQLSCLRCIYRHLVQGGRLALHLDNPNIVAMGEWLSVKRGVLQRRANREYRHPQTGRNIRSWISVEYHTSVQKMISTGVREELSDEGEVLLRAYSTMELRYTFRYEMEHLLARCGFEIEGLYGDFSGGEYRGNSPAMVWVAQGPA